ncbi:MAG: hypothetical protein HY901_16015 [Deltaproteobacteria bacterium]|nr:hypothetical protein [Deltaproteobacteria bacterium]
MRLRIALASLGLATSLAAAPAHAGPDEMAVAQAEALAAQAYERFSRGEYLQAVEYYQQAYRVAPAARMLLNVADIYSSKLNEPGLAQEYYRRYLAAPDSEPDLARLAAQRLEEQRAPWSAPAVATGAAATAAPWRAMGVTTSVVGAVALAGGAAAGIVALVKDNEAKRSCTGKACTDPSALPLTRDALRAATIADVGVIAGGVLLSAGLLMVALVPTQPAAPVKVAPALGPGQAGLVISGDWP